LSAESELGTQYNNPEIHILSAESELGTQYNNPEIHILSAESKLATQHNNPEIYILSNELQPATQYNDTLPVLKHTRTSNTIFLRSYCYTTIWSVANYCIQCCSCNYTWRKNLRYRIATVKLRFHIKCNKILFWTVFTFLHARHESEA